MLGIAGFKELIAGMFLIAFALGLREIERNPDGRIAILIGLALITAAMVPVYSLPGVGWLAITAGLWIVAQLLRIRGEGGTADVRAIVRRSLPILIPAAIVLVIVFLTQLPKVIDFINSGSSERRRHQQQAPLRRLAAGDARHLAERQLAVGHPRRLLTSGSSA